MTRSNGPAPTRHRLAALLLATGLVVLTPTMVSAEQHRPTGLERAKEATAQGLERARGQVGEAPGQASRARGLDADRARGLDRAAEAITRSRGRADRQSQKNNGSAKPGKGNAFGRGHAQEVHRVLAGGESPSQLAGVNSARVHKLVEAYNELKKVDRD